MVEHGQVRKEVKEPFEYSDPAGALIDQGNIFWGTAGFEKLIAELVPA
jgi:hypothetical protein